MGDIPAVLLLLIAAIALGVPVPIAVALGTLFGYWLIDIPLVALAHALYTGVEPVPLMTIPLFVFAGALMERGGLARRIVDVAQSLVGSYTGSLGMVAVLGCTFFAALSGSGPATTAAIGAVMVPAMLRNGYDSAFGGAVVASGGALGSLIPPSNLMIIYGVVSETSIPRLFLAGILPGIIASVLLIICAWFIARMRGFGKSAEPFSWSRVASAMWRGKWALAAPALILGGIYLGVFTPTEAASVAVVYAAVIGGLVYRELDGARIRQCLYDTAMISGTVIVILGPAKAFGELMTLMDMPALVAAVVDAVDASQFLLLMTIAAVLILTGMFLESIAQIILLTPLLLPVAVAAGVDPTVFGMLMVVACEIGFLTPPVGANLFVAARIAKREVGAISVAVLPFLATYLIVLVLIALIPQLSTALPNAVYGQP
uniref:TRAP transporter large permease protein n=1 Tax=Haliea sp. ETY-M TaxID=1055105 RepID=A0A455R567_9GAMM|nr:TRAP-type C4-dicarboxylate transport system, large permease component [Haliea sp. ETY-M]